MSTTLTKETARLQRIWDTGAARYDRQIRLLERVLFGDGRAWVCAQAAGAVLEVGIGTGRNFPFYPRGVQIVGIDLSRAMLRIARARARGLGLQVGLLEGDAQMLPFPNDRFDTVVCTLSLCEIPDERGAIREMKRVLRPGGRLLLLDHVRSSVPLLRSVQRLLERVTVRFCGDHLVRRPIEHVRAEGFQIERQRRSKLGIIERLTARKPA